MRETRRTYTKHYGGQPDGPDFTETTTGDTPSSVEVSLNAKGQAQFSIKLYYNSPVDLDGNVESDLDTIIMRVRGTLHGLGIQIAGESAGDANGSGK